MQNRNLSRVSIRELTLMRSVILVGYVHKH